MIYDVSCLKYEMISNNLSLHHPDVTFTSDLTSGDAFIIPNTVIRSHHHITRGVPRDFYFSIIFNEDIKLNIHIDGPAQECSNSIAKALGLLQYCSKPLIYNCDLSLLPTPSNTNGW